MNNCQQQPDQECSDYLARTKSITVKGTLDDISFELIIVLTARDIMAIVSPPPICEGQITECAI